MSAPDRLDQLEVKLAYLERHLLDLDEVVRAVADDVQRLRTEVADLRDTGADDPSAMDKPPHY